MDKSEIAFNLTLEALSDSKIFFERLDNSYEDVNSINAKHIADFYNTVLENLK